MSFIRRLILALALSAGLAPAFAAAPPPVPALPDTERRTSYSISASTCACNVNFALYGDSTDYGNWLEVYLNGVLVPSSGYTITSPTGSLGSIPLPITDAVLTFTSVQTGTVQIVGARRPRRVSQFNENAGVSARSLNQVLTDLVAQNREEWDRTNDITGRTVRVPPGETLSLLAAAAVRANSTLGFDALGNLGYYTPSSAVTSAANVNFLQGGTGAVSRTVQAELADTVKASQFGMKCDGVTDDAPALQLAVNAAATAANGTGAWVVLPAGTCEIYSNIYRNTFTTPGILTVPGIKIRAQSKGVTKLDTHVASDFLISANPAWRVAHQAAFSTTTSTSGGSLATNTYYLQITANDGLGHEIVVTQPKSFSVTGPTGSLSVPIPALSNPGWTYTFYCDTASTPAHYCGLGGGDATGRTPGQTIVVTSVGTAHVAPTTPVAVWQEASIRDLSITNSAGTANASGISYFKVGYSDLTNVYMKGLTGDGFSEKAYTGDIDGSFNTGIHGSKFDTINGTCVDATGAVLEQTSFTVDALSAFNVCGTAPANIGTAVTVATIPNNATPIVTTSTAHNFQSGDQIAFTVTGTTLASAYYRVGTAVTSNSFNLVDLNGVAVDTTSLGAFVSGTVTLSWRPPQTVNGAITGGGGCFAWGGLIGTLRNTNFTQCNNFAFYASEIGSNDNLTIEAVDVENTAGKGFYIGSAIGGSLKNFECLGAAASGKTIGCLQLGTGFAAGGVQNFLTDVGKVRIDSATTPVTAFEQFANTNFGATFTDTNRVRNITWSTFDATGQTRTSGFVYDSISGTVQFSISAANTAKLIPLGYGGCLPIHLKSPGEWVCYHVPSAGITGAVTGGLTPATSYNCYGRNSAASTSPYSIAFACNAHATALNEGYSVDSTDGSWTFIGTATTDGSGNFQAAGAQTSWYPATGASAPGNFSVGGNLTVVGTSNLNGLVTDGNGELMTNIAAPSTPASGFDRLWSDSTDKRLHDKNDAGTIGTTVVADTGASNNFLTAISAAGVISKAQPTFSNLATGTAPAFTLGGTVSGGGNQINNVIIGTSTPLAGTFTTLGSAAHAITSSSANALAVGANGTTNPVLNVDDSTASVATGWNVKGAAAAGKAALAVISSGTNEAGTIDGKGSGNLLLQTVATGNVGIQNTSPISTLSVGGTGNTNTDTSLEISIAGNVTAQAFNRHTVAYSVLTFAGAFVNFQSGSTASVATQISLQGGVLLGGGTTDPGAGNVQGHGFIKSESPTGGIGYATGAGGAVTQATSKATGVTLNTVTGAITMNNAALAATTIVTFVLTDSAIAATDYIGTAHESGGTTGAYTVNCRATGAGTAACDVRNNTAGSLSEAIVIRFFVHKSVNSFLMQRDLDPASNDNSPAFMMEKAA